MRRDFLRLRLRLLFHHHHHHLLLLLKEYKMRGVSLGQKMGTESGIRLCMMILMMMMMMMNTMMREQKKTGTNDEEENDDLLLFLSRLLKIGTIGETETNENPGTRRFQT